MVHCRPYFPWHSPGTQLRMMPQFTACCRCIVAAGACRCWGTVVPLSSSRQRTWPLSSAIWDIDRTCPEPRWMLHMHEMDEYHAYVAFKVGVTACETILQQDDKYASPWSRDGKYLGIESGPMGIGSRNRRWYLHRAAEQQCQKMP